MRFLYQILARLTLLLHLAVVCVIGFGWLFPKLYLVYGVCLLGSTISFLYQRRCVLTQIENYFRKKAALSLIPRTFLGYWAEAILGRHTPSDIWVVRFAVTFFLISLPVYFYNLYQIQFSFLVQ